MYYTGSDWETQGEPFIDPAGMGESPGSMLHWLARMGQPAAIAALEPPASTRGKEEEAATKDEL